MRNKRSRPLLVPDRAECPQNVDALIGIGTKKMFLLFSNQQWIALDNLSVVGWNLQEVRALLSSLGSEISHRSEDQIPVLSWFVCDSLDPDVETRPQCSRSRPQRGTATETRCLRHCNYSCSCWRHCPADGRFGAGGGRYDGERDARGPSRGSTLGSVWEIWEWCWLQNLLRRGEGARTAASISTWQPCIQYREQVEGAGTVRPRPTHFALWAWFKHGYMYMYIQPQCMPRSKKTSPYMWYLW